MTSIGLAKLQAIGPLRVGSASTDEEQVIADEALAVIASAVP